MRPRYGYGLGIRFPSHYNGGSKLEKRECPSCPWIHKTIKDVGHCQFPIKVCLWRERFEELKGAQKHRKCELLCRKEKSPHLLRDPNVPIETVISELKAEADSLMKTRMDCRKCQDYSDFARVLNRHRATEEDSFLLARALQNGYPDDKLGVIKRLEEIANRTTNQQVIDHIVSSLAGQLRDLRDSKVSLDSVELLGRLGMKSKAMIPRLQAEAKEHPDRLMRIAIEKALRQIESAIATQANATSGTASAMQEGS